MTSHDPFRVFQNIRTQQKPKFEAGEHQWLAWQGMVAACKSAGLDPEFFKQLKREAGDVALSYGELVALSGDFYGSPAELYEERPSPVPWLYESNDLSDLRKVFQQELAWIEQEKRGGPIEYPVHSIALAWNAKSYIELALENNDHFGWHNLRAYCVYHREALDFAALADRKDNSDPLWSRALFYNAFADHFLTDAFAAGHIRVPRAEIRAWAREVGYNEKIAGALSKLLHDQDGHVSTMHNFGEAELPEGEGLRVRNSLGKEWFTRCDGQLFIVDTVDQDLISQPVAAVRESLLELFAARSERKIPAGVFAALPYAPFPHEAVPGLCDKFSAKMSAAQIDELVDSTTWYSKIPWIMGLNAEKVSALLKALPDLMKRLNAAVDRDYLESRVLKERLPAPYFEAFRRLR